MKYHNPRRPPDWVLRRIDECLEYIPLTGRINWTKTLNNRIKVGQPAGGLRKDGYLQVDFQDKIFGRVAVKVHHICWYKHYGEWPASEIDHKKVHAPGNRANNRIDNLRETSHQENRWNTVASKSNKLGKKGIHYSERLSKYVVQAGSNCRKRYVGIFCSLDEATAARDRAYEDRGEFNPTPTVEPMLTLAGVVQMDGHGSLKPR